MNTPTSANTDTFLHSLAEAAELPSNLAYLPHRPGRQEVTHLLESRFPGVFRTLSDLRGDDPGPAQRFRVRAAARAVSARMSLWRERARSRRVLSRFSDVELHDLGLTRSQIFPEIHKPFWRG